MVINGEKHGVPADIILSAVHELECALVYECKSTHGLTDEQIEEIKTEAEKGRVNWGDEHLKNILIIDTSEPVILRLTS